ncbi:MULTISPECIES: UDP-N-acetylmuramoyl-tripeptide--D-alanyl-D-alanine ligase [unclassified Gordonia (in: high G+C Gram-positive bacteria)]|uniref:UDP-N-acetylmuramoyl-tripeptide--D-alanyl-D- alanine ligase n=1 Tax=Gordonia TaxID=2053 RepID=UPI001CFBA08E|nr:MULTISPECIES: UDP-N-acetylmuramoyl-tripeptide--D-alanyl-D-alanine ligase [unclassified Gordonia (in: high G+C Gram-positive bacteria)]UCZ88754.1 UDP-N-acetylmuramoyl-tripeptide--D-alanyl-D-alanine ligase [Gordonia sp. WA4-43]WGJ85991.1 UDP-N-acetylmuramoyl-tripeptide--D-alanyl-D-alanine ligase [Gordonia sp. SMJS1]
MHFRASEVAEAVGGELLGPDVQIDGASIDSRSVRPGQLFVPIVAERDGHDFIESALDGGATAYLSSRVDPVGGTAIRVADTALALADLGRAVRARVPDRVVGITGSVGKTSTKDLLAGVLRTTYRTAASEKSFNNELGLPITLAAAADDVEAVVLEMGARGVGHIDLLCSIAKPTVGVITRVEGVHLELFGDIESVARAKGELVESLPADGIAVLNADHRYVAAMADRTSARVLRYGLSPDADVYASDIVLDDELRATFRLHTPWGSTEVRLGARGEHQVPNALAAAAAAGGLGVPVESMADGFLAAELSGLRMELATSSRGVTVLNDAYNANPTSMSAALRSLATLPASRRVAVLGTMAELGADSPDQHRAIALEARDLGIEVIAVAEADYGDTARHVSDVDGVSAELGDLDDGTAVLVKGSRVAALERVAQALLD